MYVSIHSLIYEYAGLTVSHIKKQHMDVTTWAPVNPWKLCLGHEPISYSQITHAIYFHLYLNSSTHQIFVIIIITSETERMQKECPIVGKKNPFCLSVWIFLADCVTCWHVGRSYGVVITGFIICSTVLTYERQLPIGERWKCNSWSNSTQSRLLHIPHGWHLSDFTIGIVFL